MPGNPYITYYSNQAGSGISGFQGVRFQRGAGFFGNVFKSAVLPLLKYFGRQALSTGADIATDAMDGENIIESMKTRGKQASRTIANDAIGRVKRFAQTGKGRKRGRPVKVQKGGSRRKPGRSTKKVVRRRRVAKQTHKIPSIF